MQDEEELDKRLANLQSFVDEEVNSLIKLHGGHISIEHIEKTTVYVKMSGGCQGCAGAKATLRTVVLNCIKKHAPNIDSVVDITDHSAGENPFFKS